MTLVLVGGGARSGKSNFALQRATTSSMNLISKTFIATAERSDDEMTERIDRHRSERGADFITIEEPLDLAGAIEKSEPGIVIVDCLTVWLSNLMSQRLTPDYQQIFESSRNFVGEIIFVTNEVGEGIVPMHPTSREFRDLSGKMNQRFAQECDEVYYMHFGIAQKLK